MKTNLQVLVLSILVLVAVNARAQFPSSNFTLIGLTDPETKFKPDSQRYSGCWGWYQADKKKEYAIACSHAGTYWIDITVPSSPTVSAYAAGTMSLCTWREAKSYKNFLYVISDDWGLNSFQIFDMQYLPDSVHKVYDGTGLFRQAHTLWIDGDHLYVAAPSTQNTYSSMCVYSLANPANPVKLRSLDYDYPFINYVHDMYVRRDTIFASCGYQGMYIFKFNGTNFDMLGSLTSYTASGYNHSSALTPDGRTLVVTDEVPAGLPIKVCDVTNLSNIQVLATANQYTKTTPHNPFIPNNQYCFLSSYNDGLQLYDISNPATPQLAGYFDTYPQGGGNVNSYSQSKTYFGQWGCYPFFPSGNVFALDRRNGAFILRTTLYNGPDINISSDLPATACVGSSVVSTAITREADSISWSGPGLGINPGPGHSATITFSAPGIYSVVITGINGVDTASVIRTVLVSSVSAGSTGTNATCAGCKDGAIQITPSSGVPPYSYSWTPPVSVSSLASSLYAGCYTVVVSDSIGCSRSVQACVTEPQPSTGLGDLSGEGVTLYPNPASDKLFVGMPLNASHFTIHNLLGEKVIAGKTSFGTQVLDVSMLSKGVYILTIATGNKNTLARFVVE